MVELHAPAHRLLVFAIMNQREPQALSGHMNMVSWLLCFNNSLQGMFIYVEFRDS